jgi:predicted house-cleaning noncanonical NTP pyrophosphatase (MazG superfamily)
MLEIVIGALLALAIRDILYEIIDRIQSFVFAKREERYHDLLDEWLDEEV